jgi:hypothetical protein
MAEPNQKDAKPDASEEEVEASAPVSEEVGGLLTALLQETRKEVVRERDDLTQRVQDRHDEARASQERDEARRRDELQAQLLEETRKRNEALTRHERENSEQRAEDALLALESAATPAAEIDDIEVDLPVPGGIQPKSMMAMAAVLVLGIGAGIWSMQSNSQPPMELPDIASEAQKTVAEARLRWQKQQAAAKAAAEAKALKEAEQKVQEAERARLDAERKALDAERKALDAERKALDSDEEGGDEAADGEVVKKKPKRKRRKRGLKLKKGLF